MIRECLFLALFSFLIGACSAQYFQITLSNNHTDHLHRQKFRRSISSLQCKRYECHCNPFVLERYVVYLIKVSIHRQLYGTQSGFYIERTSALQQSLKRDTCEPTVIWQQVFLERYASSFRDFIFKLSILPHPQQRPRPSPYSTDTQSISEWQIPLLPVLFLSDMVLLTIQSYFEV